MREISVQVDCERTETGEERPRRIRWADGRVFAVDRISHTCASPDGEYAGIRYTVLVGRRERYLYRDGDRWYVERL